jgi:serine/threonine-protein kinase
MAGTRDSWPQADPGVREGDVLAGKYRVEKILGVGGMGVVVAAHHLHLDAKVAIKFLLPEALKNEEAVARFAREARAAVKIKSEHVARVVDVGTLDNGAPYMVMEYLDGGDLGAWIQQRGVLQIEQAVELVLQTCEAVAEAHALGIIHRDLKPANLFCIRRSDGVMSAKVLDFGISKLNASNPQSPEMGITRTTAVIGSPLYMSPEQMLASRDVDPRTDIWALGVILYEMLTGRPPFVSESFAVLCVKISSERPPPPRERRPDLPKELEEVILKCLEKDREKRYPNVAALAVALAPFGPRRSRPSVERVSRIIQASGLSTSALAMPVSSERGRGGETQQSWGGTRSASPSARGWVWGVAVGAIVLAAAGWVWVSRKNASVAQLPAPSAPVLDASSALPIAAAGTQGSVVLTPAARALDWDAGQAPERPRAASKPQGVVKKNPNASARHNDAFARPD